MKASADFITRHARIEDLAAITAIYNATVPTRMVTADTEPVTTESRMTWFHEHSPQKRPLWVMEKDEMIVGWLSYQSFYGRPAYDATAEISIYIHNDYRKLGLGKRLLQFAIEKAPGLQVSTLLGFIFGHNTPSLRLFRQFGFEIWAQLPRIARLDGIERDLLIVGKRIE